MGQAIRTSLSGAIAVSALAMVLGCPGGVCAQGLTGRFYPEKETYLLGEPIFIVYEVEDAGEKSVRWGTEAFYGPCSQGFTFEVPGAPLRPEWQLKCRLNALDCLGSLGDLRPGEKSIQRFLLNERYQFKEPGDYDVTAASPGRVDPLHVYDSNPPVEAGFKSSFRITLVKAEPKNLQAAFQPYIQSLKDDHALRGQEAVVAVTELVPPFLEDLIVQLAGDADDWRVSRAIEALLRLNTPKARRALAQLTELSKVQQQAIEALGKTGDRTYLPLLIRLARGPERYNRYSAARAAGELGGLDAVQPLLLLLQDPDPTVRIGAVQGLENTRSREAVPGLLMMFTDADSDVRQSAVNAFTSLTHAPGDFNVKDPVGAKQVKKRTLRWWLLNGEKSPIYGPQDCSETQPITLRMHNRRFIPAQPCGSCEASPAAFRLDSVLRFALNAPP